MRSAQLGHTVWMPYDRIGCHVFGMTENRSNRTAGEQSAPLGNIFEFIPRGAPEQGRVHSSRFDVPTGGCYDRNAGWSSLVARWAHNPKVGGSNPPPATKTLFWFQWVEPISQTDSTTLNPDSQPIFPKLFTHRFTRWHLGALPVSLVFSCSQARPFLDCP